MEWEIKPEGNGNVLILRGSATLPYASELKDALAAIIAASGDVTIDVQDIQEFDLAGLQLLGSAHHSAVAQARTFQLLDNQATFREAVFTAGFNRKKGCNACPGEAPCLWVINDQPEA